MRIKSVSFGYLEFSRDWGETIPTRARAAARPTRHRGRVRVWDWARVWVRVQAQIQPSLVLFEPGHTSLVLQAGLDPLHYLLAALQLLE